MLCGAYWCGNSTAGEGLPETRQTTVQSARTHARLPESGALTGAANTSTGGAPHTGSMAGDKDKKKKKKGGMMANMKKKAVGAGE